MQGQKSSPALCLVSAHQWRERNRASLVEWKKKNMPNMTGMWNAFPFSEYMCNNWWKIRVISVTLAKGKNIVHKIDIVFQMRLDCLTKSTEYSRKAFFKFFFLSTSPVPIKSNERRKSRLPMDRERWWKSWCQSVNSEYSKRAFLLKPWSRIGRPSSSDR